MKLDEILGSRNGIKLLEEMLEPTTARPPKDKGADAIKVTAYIVHGHWRRRWHPNVVSMRGYRRKRA